MKKQFKVPNYIKIATDIAYRIINNEFIEGSKITKVVLPVILLPSINSLFIIL